MNQALMRKKSIVTTDLGMNLDTYVKCMLPSIIASKGNLVQIHPINEEKNQFGIPSKHNLNIDEFNVHTKDLEYFPTDSITFLADRYF